MCKRIISVILALMFIVGMLPLLAVYANEATTLSSPPYALLNYSYSTAVSCGTIRYISQSTSSSKFNWNYWPESSFGEYKSPGSECGTACLSMALSYIGINKTPKDILVPYDGVTTWDNWDPAHWTRKKTDIANSIDTMYTNYVNGNGMYSPLVVHLNLGQSDEGEGDQGHFIILAGRVDSNTWQIVDPASSAVKEYDIIGNSITYMGVANIIDQVHQWYNPSVTNIIEDSYPSYCQIQISSSTTYVKSLPCSAATDPASTNVEVATKGAYYTAIGLYKNTAGNLWYKVKTSSGAVGYIYAGDTTYISRKTKIDFDGVSAPTELKKGSVFSIKGVISAEHLRLHNVGAYVKASDNTIKTGTVIDVDTTSYDLYNSSVDAAVKFNELAAGTYTYYVVAAARSYYAQSATQYSYESDSVVLHESTFTVVEEISCNHSYTSVVTAPTCTSKGYTTYTCKSCGYSYIGNTTSATGHSYGDWVTVTAATCTTDGAQKSTCSACGDVKTQTIAASGHNYTSKVIEATCVEYEKTIYTCSGCGDSYTEYGTGTTTDWSTEKPVGVDESLIESRTEYRYQTKEYTTSTSSSMSGWTLYDTTTQWGEYGSWSEWSDTVATASDSTKVETRVVYKYYYYACPSCGAHMHGWNITCPTWAGGCGKATIGRGDYVVIWSTVSYDDAGLKDFYGTGKYYATIDGQRVFKSGSDPKTQYRYCTREQEAVYHFYKWSGWSDWSGAAVSENDGVNVETRTVYRYVEIELGDHQYTSSVTAPTCNSQGYTIYTCTVCGDSYKDNYTAAIGHSYSYAVTKAPTTSAAGTLTGTCSKCSGTTTVTLPKLSTTDYTYSVIKEPTYTATGTGRYTWKTATYGAFYFEVTLDKLTATLTKIEIVTAPSKTTYKIGESLDTTGLSLKLTYSDGSTKTVTSGFATSGFDSSTAGIKSVKVTYGGKETNFTVTVVQTAVGEDTPIIKIESKTARAGETVTVNVTLENNPGISSAVLKIEYDATRLKLENAVFGDIFANGAFTNYNLPYVALVGSGDITEDAVLLTLTFTVSEDASEGEAYVFVRYEDGDITNYEEESVSFAVSDGKVMVTSYMPGDINDDGVVNTKDLTRLLKYISHETVEFNEYALDVNGDGKVNTKDLTRLLKYISHEDVEIH